MGNLTDRARLRSLCKILKKRYGKTEGGRMCGCADARYEQLCSTLSQYPEALRSHLIHNIFPSMAVFDALLAEGRSREEAARLTDEFFSMCMEPIAKTIRVLCRIPGMYRKIPVIFKTKAPEFFGPDAGFDARVYDTEDREAKFDMLVCPYWNTCRALGYEELAPLFCHSDDICYGNMHRKLIWNRTKTLARGGDLCDFDLYIQK